MLLQTFIEILSISAEFGLEWYWLGRGWRTRGKAGATRRLRSVSLFQRWRLETSCITWHEIQVPNSSGMNNLLNCTLQKGVVFQILLGARVSNERESLERLCSSLSSCAEVRKKAKTEEAAEPAAASKKANVSKDVTTFWEAHNITVEGHRNRLCLHSLFKQCYLNFFSRHVFTIWRVIFLVLLVHHQQGICVFHHE